MSGKYLSDGAEGVLAYGGEDGRTGEVPKFLDFSLEFSEEISNSVDRLDVIGVRSERGSEGMV